MNCHNDDPLADSCTLIDVLQRWALLQAEQCVYTFLGDRAREEARLTYGELDRRARALGARLQQLGLAGERALLLYPPGLEFIVAFFGCLYAGAVAVPANMPRPNRPMNRFQSIVADAAPKAVLTTTTSLADKEGWTAGVPELRGIHWLETDCAAVDAATAWRDPGASRETLAFLQYTSGSTAASKGVMLSHGNLLHNSALIHRCFETSPHSRGVFWLPLYHDMGLIGGVVQTLYCGSTSTFFAPVAFLQRPFRWLEAISQTGATISGGPNFAYELCVRKITPEQKAKLDLSRWKVAFNGAEPIRAETLERFAEAFAPCGFQAE